MTAPDKTGNSPVAQANKILSDAISQMELRHSSLLDTLSSIRNNIGALLAEPLARQDMKSLVLSAVMRFGDDFAVSAGWHRH